MLVKQVKIDSFYLKYISFPFDFSAPYHRPVNELDLSEEI